MTEYKGIENALAAVRDWANEKFNTGTPPNVVDTLPESPIRDTLYYLTKPQSEGALQAGVEYPNLAPAANPAITESLYRAEESDLTEFNGERALLFRAPFSELASDMGGIEVISGGDSWMYFINSVERDAAYLFTDNAIVTNEWAIAPGWSKGPKGGKGAFVNLPEGAPEELRGPWTFSQAAIDSGFADALFDDSSPAGFYRHDGTDWILLMEAGGGTPGVPADFEARIAALELALGITCEQALEILQ